MTTSKNTGHDIPEQQDADGADIKQRGNKIEDDILGLCEMIQDAKLKHGTVPAETARAIANIRAALELLESEHLVNDPADATAKEVHLVKTAALGLLNQKAPEPETEKVNDKIPFVEKSSEPAELSEQEIAEWNPGVSRGSERLGDAVACVINIPDPGKSNAHAYKKLKEDAAALGSLGGSLPFILRDVEVNMEESQRNDLRLSLISCITKASDLLAEVKGMREGRRVHDGFMGSNTSGDTAVLNLSSAIVELYPVLDELGVPEAERMSMEKMYKEALAVKQGIADLNNSENIRNGARAVDFSGSFAARRRRLA